MPAKISPCNYQPRVGAGICGYHRRAVAAVKFSPDGSLLGSASADKTVQIWNTKDCQPRNMLTGHAQGLSDLAWTEDSRKIATASDDKLIKIFDVETGQEISTLQGHDNYVFCVNFNNPQANLLVSGSYNEMVGIWDIFTFAMLLIS
ncbi:unnamed protein product [Discosporangium mesarthrocarpum]